MKRLSIPSKLWATLALVVLVAALLFAPGIRYRFGDPSVFEMDRRNQSLRVNSCLGEIWWEWWSGPPENFDAYAPPPGFSRDGSGHRLRIGNLVLGCGQGGW